MNVLSVANTVKIDGVLNNIGYHLLDCIDKKLKHCTKYLPWGRRINFFSFIQQQLAALPVTLKYELCFLLFQNVMEQFNPGLRNLVNLGKSYEKAVTGNHIS